MSNKTKALELVRNKEEIIRERLFGDGYMFDDEIDQNLTAPVARELTGCIEEFFLLEEDEYVIRSEINDIERSDGVLYYSGSEKGFSEVIEIAKRHYNIFDSSRR